MKPLSDQYRKNTYDFKLVERNGDIAIYEQTDPDTNQRVAYEVFEVMKRPERVIAGKIILAAEGTPSNEDWGTFGYTVWTFEAAKEKERLLQDRLSERLRKRELAKMSDSI